MVSIVIDKFVKESDYKERSRFEMIVSTLQLFYLLLLVDVTMAPSPVTFNKNVLEKYTFSDYSIFQFKIIVLVVMGRNKNLTINTDHKALCAIKKILFEAENIFFFSFFLLLPHLEHFGNVF